MKCILSKTKKKPKHSTIYIVNIFLMKSRKSIIADAIYNDAKKKIVF
jgi:hypothetical protein